MATARTNVPRTGSASIRSSSLYLSRSKGSSTRSLPLAATTTKLNITSNTSDLPTDKNPNNETLTINVDGARDEQRRQLNVDKNESVGRADIASDRQNSAESRKLPSATSDSKDTLISDANSADISSRWLGWFSKPTNQNAQDFAGEQVIATHGQMTRVEAVGPSSRISLAPQDAVARQGQNRDLDPNFSATGKQRNLRSPSWLRLWGNVALPVEKSSMSEVAGVSRRHSHDNSQVQIPVDNPGQDTKRSLSTSQGPAIVTETPKSAGWAFWSRENLKDERSGSKENFGKLALAGSPSQSHPENAVIDETQRIPSKVGRNERSKSVEKVEDRKSSELEDVAGGKSEASSSNSTSKTIDQAHTGTKTSSSNLVLPSLARTFRVIDKPSMIQQLSRFLQSSRLPDTKHVSIVSNPPRIQRALAIVISLS